MNEDASKLQTDMSEHPESSSYDSSLSVTFEYITFSDGTTIHLDPADIVVLVGPNNAGKSAALRELGDVFARDRQSTVLLSYETRKVGSKGDFAQHVDQHTQTKFANNTWTVSGYKLNHVSRLLDLESFWPDRLEPFKSLFCLNMPAETRIGDSDPAPSINTQDEPLQHPIHLLIDDDELELKISEHFHRAFQSDLILDRTLSRTISLLVGIRPIPDIEQREDRLSKTYQGKVHASTTPLVQQGDGMRSFASVILHLLAPTNASILLLDEPEAFLHPPQARLLGEIMATEKAAGAQLFVATHSSDVLQGLVNVHPDRLRLVRMQRDGNINRVKELDKGLVKQISSSPLMNYSSVISGVFHERVIVCESDSDCMFYRTILDLNEVHGDGQPDVLFIHANGKDRIAALAEILIALDVQVDVIADIDVLRDEAGLKRMVTALGGDWSRIEPGARNVRTAIDASKPSLSIDQVKESVRSELTLDLPDSEPERHLRSRIDAVFRHSSPWDALKQSGESAIPKGQATQKFQEMLGLCREAGLWIVPVGEMEGFCRSIGGHGPNWVQQVIEQRTLATDENLAAARAFVREIWERRP